MRIGLSTSVIQRGRSGIGQAVLALARGFAAAPGEHQFVLYVLEEDLPLFAFARETMQLIPVSERFRPAVRNILWHQRVLPQLARAHQLDVLHVPSYRRMLWPRPCALVATVHDLAPFRIARKYDPLRMFYGRVVARELARRQDRIIAISETTARDLKTFFGTPEQRINVVHNGLDHERFSPAPPALARAVAGQRFGLKPPYLLYVARLEHPGKNHLRLITAFNEFKKETPSQIQLVLAGADWHGASAIHEAVAQSPFKRDIRSLGFISDDDLPKVYRGAEAAVYPSLYEGFGLPALEAMACGCPVLSSNRGALPEVVGDAGLLVDPEDATALKTQLTRIATDEVLRERLRWAGLERAKQFDWSETATRTLEVYRQAISQVKNQRTDYGFSQRLSHP